MAMEIGRPYGRLLHRLEMFRPLTPEDRQRIAELPLTVTNLPSHQELRQQDRPVAHCTLVLSGFLCAHKRIGHEQRQITSFFVPGDIADLHTFYLDSLDCGLATLGAAVVALLPHSALQATLEDSPRLAEAFWRQSLLQAGTFRAWLTNLGRRDALARVAHLICEITVRLQAVELARDWRFAIPWTQADIADACGISNVHANRVVQTLRRQGIVEWTTKTITIRDWDRLAALAGFSDDYLYAGPLTRVERIARRSPAARGDFRDQPGAALAP